MKRILSRLAMMLFIGTLVTWLATGANRGWTKTSEPVKIMDDVTGIEGITYQKRFAPGLDFVGAGLLVTGILAGASLLFRAKSN